MKIGYKLLLFGLNNHRTGMSITDADLLIAVSALRCDAILVTNNERHLLSLHHKSHQHNHRNIRW